MKNQTLHLLFHFIKSIRNFIVILIGLGISTVAYSQVTVTTAPTNVKVSVSSSSATSIMVSFNRPTYSGTGNITYSITVSPSAGTSTNLVQAQNVSTGSITVSSLTTGTAYTFTVSAVGGAGSTWTSTASSSITPRTVTTLYFHGTTNTDWGTATNWSTNSGTPSIGSAVPTANDIAIINANKTVNIGASVATTAVCQKLTLSSGASLTNYSGSSLTVSPTDVSGVALALSGGTFDNEGTLTVTNVNQTTPYYNSIACNGTNTLTFNGTNNLAVYPAGQSNALFVGGSSTATTIAGTGFTVGSAGSGTGVGYSVFSLSATLATVTINSGTTLNMYVGATGNNGNGFYLASSSSVINNGTLNVTGTVTSASYAISASEGTAGLNTSFKNTGTFTVTGFNQPFSFGGTNGYNKFENTNTAGTTPGTTDITTNSGGAYGLCSTAVLPNQYINSGTLKINAPTNAIKINASGDTFTNTGTITITKGNVYSAAAAGSYPTINNNSGGVINFNYSVSNGSTSATSGVILSNNSGATINGSCTFAAGTLVANSESTLSPGDYNTGTSTSGIGKMIITPTSSAFTLGGNVNIQVNGKTTAGTDYDQISFASTCALTLSSANTLTVTTGGSYTPAASDRISLISTTTKSGTFATSTVPVGWNIDYATATDIAVKYGVTWTGGASDGLWSSPANWSNLSVPISTSDVFIGAYTVTINNSTSAAVNSLSLTGSNLTNSGTLTIAPASSKDGIYINASTFVNEGTLSINSSYRCIELSGTNALTFNGTTTFAGSTVFVPNSSSATTISGTGFSLGSVGTPIGYGLISTTSTGSTFTINSGTTMNVYSNSGNVIYMSNSAGVTNNGTLNIYTSTTGTGVHALQIWETGVGLNATFTNGSTGTLLMSGYEQPTVFGGTTGYCKFDNAGTATISTSSAAGALGLFSTGNLPNVFTNSGTLNISATYRAIVLNAKTYNGSFTNTGTLNITKGLIFSAGASASVYNTIDNNSPGKINFNYGFPAGTTTATSAAIINNNSGATINGSCTFAASTLVTNSGSTLSPGDYSAGVSGIGKMIFTPASAAFTLAGNVNLQVNGKTTAGTDYDQIAFASTCALTLSGSPVINMTVGYTPTYNDRISVISSNTLSGSLGSPSLPAGWVADYDLTDVAVKYPSVVPGAPAIGTAVVSGVSGTATVAFTAPVSNGGSAITSYTATSSPAGGTGTLNQAGSGTITVTGLTNGTPYTFTVKANNAAGASAASEPTSPEVTPYSVPDAPTSVMATAGNEQASVTFTAPASNGGSAITSYTVTPYVGATAGSPVTQNANPIVVTGLINGTAYTFTVIANNAAGASAVSTASSAVTPVAPISILSTETKTPADLGLTAASVVTVDNGGTLNINATTTVNSVTVGNSGKLIVASGQPLTVGTLTLTGGIDGSATTVKLDANITATTVRLLKTIDKNKWYFMSFPYNVVVADITKSNGDPKPTLNGDAGDLFIKYYDGEQRGLSGTGSNWKHFVGAELIANQGYIFGLSNSQPVTTLSFPLKTGGTLTAETVNRNISVAENTGALPNNRGWNLIGQPFLSKYIASNASGLFDIYVYDGISNNYTPFTKANVPNINPFSAYFIQASTALAGTGITFDYSTGRQLSPSVAANELMDEVQLDFTSSTGSDYALLRMDNSLTTGYDLGSDLEKWIGIGTTKPQIYTSLGGINYAFNALPMTNVVNLPLGIYTQTVGITTIHAAGAKAPSLSKLLLTDNSTSPATVTDLLMSDYSFTAAAGTDNSRFVITAQRISTENLIKTEVDEPQLSTLNCQLSIKNLSPNSVVRVFDALGRMVANKTVSNNALQIKLSAKGMYTVQIEAGGKSWVKKIVN